jgi:hypothetical protein
MVICYLDRAGAGELSHGELHEVEGPPDEDENHQVGDEEGSPSVLVGFKKMTLFCIMFGCSKSD